MCHHSTCHFIFTPFHKLFGLQTWSWPCTHQTPTSSRCAHIFLGKCLPPVTGRKNSLLRTAYGISPDRNLRDRQCSMRVNARANPPTAPQFSLPSQPPSKCLDISTSNRPDKPEDTSSTDAKKRWTAAAAKTASATKSAEPE